jgi:hypothetical protein
MPKSIFALNRPLSDDEMMSRRRSLVRLGLAWLAMMQVMMFALPGYLRQDSFGQDSLDVLDWFSIRLGRSGVAWGKPGRSDTSPWMCRWP